MATEDEIISAIPPEVMAEQSDTDLSDVSSEENELKEVDVYPLTALGINDFISDDDQQVRQALEKAKSKTYNWNSNYPSYSRPWKFSSVANGKMWQMYATLVKYQNSAGKWVGAVTFTSTYQLNRPRKSGCNMSINLKNGRGGTIQAGIPVGTLKGDHCETDTRRHEGTGHFHSDLYDITRSVEIVYGGGRFQTFCF